MNKHISTKKAIIIAGKAYHSECFAAKKWAECVAIATMNKKYGSQYPSRDWWTIREKLITRAYRRSRPIFKRYFLN